jgi:two-component system, cell cycle response regulator DivK
VASRPCRKAASAVNTERGRGVVILVVEDNPANQMLIEAVLHAEGYRVNIAGSAPDALVSIQDDRPDLILMDIQLPGQDGLSLTRQLKSNPAQARIPVVAMTAHAMAADRQRSLDAGCVGYITKPFDTRLIPSQIAGFLGPAE